AGVLEGVRAGQPVALRYPQVGQLDLGLPHRPQRTLAVDASRVVTGRALLDEEPLDLPVGVVARPDDHDVGDGAVADPLLLPVEHPRVAIAVCARLQRHRVGAVQRFGERERADRRQLGNRWQPPLLLRLGTEQRDRPHRQPRLYPEEGAQAAVAAVDFHVHQAGGDRAERRAAVPVDAVPDDAQLGEPRDQRHRELRALPVPVDDRQYLVVDEVAGTPPDLAFGGGQLVADAEVVGAERAADVLVHDGCPLPVQYIGAGRLDERAVDGGGGRFGAAALRQPVAEVGPPAAGDGLRAVEPVLRVGGAGGVDAVGGAGVARRVDHRGDVAAGGQHEPGGTAEQRGGAVAALPRRDVVGDAGDDVGVGFHRAQVDRGTE